MGEASAAPHISIAAGVTVGLVAAFIQSLGLTIQRKSHLQNEALPQEQRKKDYRRPLWIAGFVSFIISNVLGSIFQLGALPIVVLAPLGAVSLLWNAFFSRILLGDVFSKYLILGTFLIAGGAVLIAIFGVIPESTHGLDELVQLYIRPRFVICLAVLAFFILIIVSVAHLTEWRINRKYQQYAPLQQCRSYESLCYNYDENQQSSPKKRKHHLIGNSTFDDSNILFSSPNTSPTRLTHHHANDNNYLPRPLSTSPVQLPVGPTTLPEEAIPGLSPPTSPKDVSFNPQILEDGYDYESERTDSSQPISMSLKKSHANNVASSTFSCVAPQTLLNRQYLWVGVAYGSVSGSLSGLCLLFAKTGVELLITTIVARENQFRKWQSWVIIIVLLCTAILQLWYLNKSLRLVGPTLICPLAFCFYNTVSIFGGLVYYNQLHILSPINYGLVFIGIVLLLTGVWIVSLKTEDSPVQKNGDDEDDEEYDVFSDTEDVEDPFCPTHHDEDEEGQTEQAQHDFKGRLADFTRRFLNGESPRGFSIGLSASSPGFAIRPMNKRSSLLGSSSLTMPDNKRMLYRSATVSIGSGLASSTAEPFRDTERSPLRPDFTFGNSSGRPSGHRNIMRHPGSTTTRANHTRRVSDTNALDACIEDDSVNSFTSSSRERRRPTSSFIGGHTHYMHSLLTGDPYVGGDLSLQHCQPEQHHQHQRQTRRTSLPTSPHPSGWRRNTFLSRSLTMPNTTALTLTAPEPESIEENSRVTSIESGQSLLRQRQRPQQQPQRRWYRRFLNSLFGSTDTDTSKGDP